MRFAGVITAAFLASACGEQEKGSRSTESDTGGTLVIAMPSDPGSIFPPFALNTYGRLLAAQIYDHLADVGPGMNTIGDAGFRRQLAERWTWSADSLSIAFQLNPRARWHDGKPVTARDVLFSVALYRNPALGAPTVEELARMDSVTATDSLTVVYWFRTRSPTQFLDAAAQIPILPEHILKQIPVETLRATPPPLIGTGRFRLKQWDKGASGELVADSGNYRGRAKLDRLIWTASTGTSSATKLFTGAADLFDAMRPEDVRDASGNPDLRLVTLNGLDYAFLHFNLRDPTRPSRPHPLFGNRDLRRAIAMSVNRDFIVRSIFDTLALVPVGPTARAYPTTDHSIRQVPFDTVRGRSLLDSLGWTRRGEGRLRTRKNGRELAFTVVVPASSQNRVRAAVLLQAQLRNAGIRMNIEQMDHAAFYSRWSERRFDAALGAWNMGSTPGITPKLWGTRGIAADGTNFGSYSNSAFDAHLDSALSARDVRSARRFFSQAYRIINEDVPAIWLYEPKTVIGIHRRIQPSAMRQGAWWSDLGNWSIRAAERLPRDQLPAAR